MKIIVLGAGVIGVTTAYFLARAGHEVVVLEKNSASTLGCSYANGGQLSYSHIETWATKVSFLSLFKDAIMPDSFLSFSDFANKVFWKWFYEFYKNSSPLKARENSHKLFHLSSYSREILAQIIDEEKDIKFDYKPDGILHFFRNQKKLDSAIKDAEFSNTIGCRAQILSAKECIKKEPTLVKMFDEKKLAGGIFYETDASGNCMLFTKALEKICREKHAVVFEYNTEVKNILTNYKKITGVNSSKGVFTADKYVYALGAYGNKLLYGIGIDPKIYPLKGYSLSIPTDSEFIAPNTALTDSENKIVYSRFNNIFRAAGLIEISGLKNRKNLKMIRFLSKIIHTTFSDFGNFNQASDCFGFRPFRPNSVPLICEVKKYGNFFLNAGHGSLGWTLSAASGKILADLVSNQRNKKFGFLEDEEEAIYKS